jgi:DNA-binding LytR/AlgR family response regulator
MSRDPGRPGTSARILLIDDDLPLAAGLKEALERQGHLVLVLDRGSKALEAAKRFDPQLVLLDVMMPGMDGWEVLRQLREHQSTQAVPVIMLTGADSEAAKVTGFSLGADDYVTKPFSLQELRCRIDAVLRRTLRTADESETETIPVVSGRPGFELLRSTDVYYVEGVRNYTYVHTFDSRSLCRMSLGEVDGRQLPGFMRVQRSFIVNLDHVRGCGWVTKSSYQIRLADLAGTEITVSRALIPEVQRRIGIKG